MQLAFPAERATTERMTSSDWTTLTGEELGAAVVSAARGLWDDDAGRRMQMLDAISRHEGRRNVDVDVAMLRQMGVIRSDEEIRTRLNVVRILVNTAVAKIAGMQQPKVQFVASNADWVTRRKAPKLDQFVTGLWSTRQGPYADIWELGVAAFRDAAVCGMGAIKTWSDIDAGRVANDRVFPWELLTDPFDARRGCPSNLFHVYTAPKPTLCAVFPEHDVAIRDARIDTGDDTILTSLSQYLGTNRVSDSTRVYEWWSLPLSTDVPGKHVIAIDGAVLLEEEWTRDSFPFALIRWDRDFIGWNGTSLVSSVAALDDEMNEILGRISRTVRLTSIGICVVQDGAVVSGDAIDNGDANVITVDRPGALQYLSPPPFSQEYIEYLNLIKGFEYEASGINQMTATAQRPAGVDAAVAMRTLADLQSEIFSVVWRAYQGLFVEIARNSISCVRELADDDKNFSVKWPGNGFLKTIEWSSVDLEDDLYTIQIASAPTVKGTPADRLQSAQELFGAGMISQDSFMAVRQYLDLPGELDRVGQQRKVIERYIEQWLDADPQLLAEGDMASLKTDDGQPLFRPPIKWMRLEDALLQVADAYLQAELDGVPDENRDLFLRWIEMADAEIIKKQERMADLEATTIQYRQAQQQPPGAPPGAPPMPPGAPA